VTAIALVGEDALDDVARQRLHVGDHGFERVAIIGIARQLNEVVASVELAADVASRTRISRARLSSFANMTFLGCTVVSTIMRLRSALGKYLSIAGSEMTVACID
jgi:hypothetical protein